MRGLLDAYAQLLLSPEPNYRMVAEGCGVLVAFGVGFVGAGMAFPFDLD